MRHPHKVLIIVLWTQAGHSHLPPEIHFFPLTHEQIAAPRKNKSCSERNSCPIPSCRPSPSPRFPRRHLCTSSKDRTCLLWDLELGVPVVRWSGHADAVGAVAASRKPGAWLPTAAPGGAFVISGAADRTLQRWDVPSKAVAVLEAEARDSRSAVEAAGVAGMLEAGGTGEGEGEEDAGARRKKGP